MLVLTRRVGEEIVIGDDIRVTVLAATNGRICLGIAAPATTRVLRSEVIARVKQAGGASAQNRRAELV